MEAVTGVRELLRNLESLDKKTGKKAARNGINAGLRVLVKGMKSEVPSPYKDAKKAIGGRFDKKGGTNRNEVRARAGAAVGVKQKTIKARAEKQKKKRSEEGKSPGSIGINPSNLHWFILGTENRRTKRPDKLGRPAHSTGKMEAVMPNVIKDGFAKSESAAMQKIVEKVRETIQREAAK